MAADWLFWGIAAVTAALCLGVAMAPLLAGAARGARRASYDMQVHRDQLREVEADLARGVLSDAEAAATRIEVSRRLLAAAEVEAGERVAGAAPRRLRWVAPVAIAGLALAGLGLYATLGAPGFGDQPLAARMARDAELRAQRPGQADAEAAAARMPQAGADPAAGEDQDLVAKLQAALATRPDDLQGHRLLAQSLATLGRWPEARAAQERVVAILGDAATSADLVDLAEIRIIAAGGYVSPEAEAALSRAMALDPANPAGRYYSALTLMQGGRPDLAYRMWSTLVHEGPADAPWIAPARAGMAEAARLAGRPVPGAAPGAAGPSDDDIAAAAQLPPEDRQAMIEGMVAQLSQRLAAEGGPPEDWARLIRSLAVLGRGDEAAAILAEARQVHAGDAAALAVFAAAAQDAGLAP